MSTWTGSAMREHYLKGGYKNVQIRDSIGLLAEDEHGQPFQDIESLAIASFYQSGIDAHDTVVDVGSGYPPYFLRLLKLNGHDPNRLVAIEPHMDNSNVSLESSPNDFEGINIVRALAEALPLKQKSVKVITALRSLYHLGEEALTNFFDGADQALQAGGMMGVWLRGEHYKEKIGQTEIEVTKPLSKIMGSDVKGPQRINAGLTTEKALPWFLERYDYVLELRQQGKIKIVGSLALEMVLNHHLTLTDMYEDEYGRQPTRKQHLAALHWCLSDQIAAVVEGTAVMLDTFDQSFIIASKVPQNLPHYFKEIHDMSDRANG